MKLAAYSLAVSLIATAAAAAPVDLSTWVQDGDGDWELAADNQSVFQDINSRPTTYHNNQALSQGKSLSGTITVSSPPGDDDWIGFVLGYTQGDIGGSNPGIDYLLIDWKGVSQGGWDAGLALSRVTGDIDVSATATNSDPWDHVGDVQFLTRSNVVGSQYGTTGWTAGTTYTFDLEFTASNVKVYIDGILEIDYDGAFADGAFGFYNYSQPNVTYAGITEDVILDPVPLPAGLPLLLAGLGAFGLLRRRARA